MILPLFVDGGFAKPTKPSVTRMDSSEGDNLEVKRALLIKQYLDQMSEAEKSRFEFSSRSHFNRAQIKEIMATCLGKSIHVSEEMAIAVSSLAKIFVGEIVETATEYMADQGLEGNVMPEYIMEAARRLQLEQNQSCADRSFYFDMSTKPGSIRLDNQFNSHIAILDEPEVELQDNDDLAGSDLVGQKRKQSA